MASDIKKVALVIGHSEGSQGAKNTAIGTTEFQFNEPLAHDVADRLIGDGFEVELIYRDDYSSLPSKVNDTGSDVAISMHCNAFDESASGAEVLYYKGSANGRLLASCIQDEVVKVMRENDRGLKPCSYSYLGKAGDRGGHLLKRTAMPCVIVEPFFIDCDKSLTRAVNNFDCLAGAYASGIKAYFYKKGL